MPVIEQTPSLRDRSARGVRALRTHLHSRDLTIGVGAHDAVGARLIQNAGFHFIWASGLAISAANGVPDSSIVSMDKLLEAAKVMAKAIDLPVVSDCDTGFGGVENAVHMAEQYALAGIAGVCIEDKVFPKRNSFAKVTHQLEDVAEFSLKIARMRAAVQADELVIIARTESLIAGFGVEEAHRRVAAYVDAGADAILVHSKASDIGEIEAFMRTWRGSAPIIVVPTTYGSHAFGEFSRLGVSSVICANQLLRASILQMRNVLADLSVHHSLGSIEHAISPLAELVTMFDRPINA